jgi:hypothetical protein
MKCKVRRDMRDEKRVRTKNGRSGISGMCTVCGGKIFRLVGAAAKTKGKISSKKRTTKLGKEKRKARESSRQKPSIKKTAVVDIDM